MNDEVEAFYSGIEPVEIGSLDDVKEQRTVIPATKNVRMRIKKAEVQINKDNTYRSINLQLQIVNGIDAEGKYKGKVVFGKVCYYADPNTYTKDFFKQKQHLVELKKLIKATGIEYQGVVDGHFIDRLMQSTELSADIQIRKRKVKLDDGTFTEELDNETRNYKQLSAEELV